MNTWIQRSLAGGEISPAIAARADMTKYQTGLRSTYNMFVQKWGGVSNRPGTRIVAEVKTSAKSVRIIPFVFNASQTYVLELGDNYMRVHQAGVQLALTPVAITNILNSNPCQVTAAGHGLVDGDEIQVYGITGMDELNGRNFKVWNVLGANFTLRYMGTGTQDVDSIPFTPYVSGGFLAKVYEIATPWPEADLQTLQYQESADVITVVHSNHPIYEIKRTGHTAWTVTPKTLGASLPAPGAPTVTGGPGAGINVRYKVTAIAWEPWSESLASPNSNTINMPTPSNPADVTWPAVAGADEYNVYRYQNGMFAWVGNAGTGLTFHDEGGVPDFSGQPPKARILFAAPGDYPSVVCYYQQRLGFANTDNDPQGVWFGRTADFVNFNLDVPIRDDSSVTFEMAGRQVNRIRHMVDIGRLVILTDTGEFVAEGDAAGILTPADINLRQQGYVGSSELMPIVAGGMLLYVQARGTVVRDFGYEFQSDDYRGNDLTIFAGHLFEGYTIRDWAYQQSPHSIIWVARSDGWLLGLTYVREHQVWAWHKHFFRGSEVESLCTIPDGNEDALYLVRNGGNQYLGAIGGTQRRYIERLTSRQVDSVEGVFMDQALTYDGRNTTGTSMRVEGGVTWAVGETMQVRSTAPVFLASDVGNEFWVEDILGSQVKMTVVAYTSNILVDAKPNKNVPVALQNTYQTTWARAVDEVGGLWHLEGIPVSVVGNGFVLASPSNPDYTLKTVTNGRIQLDGCFSLIHAGFPYSSEIETLDLDSPQLDPSVDKKKLITRVALIVKDTRGLRAAAAGGGGFTEYKIRQFEDYESPVSEVSGKITVEIFGNWSQNGRVIVRQIDPLPCTILGVIPSGQAPTGTGG